MSEMLAHRCRSRVTKEFERQNAFDDKVEPHVASDESGPLHFPRNLAAGNRRSAAVRAGG